MPGSIAIDTNRYADLARRLPDAVQRVSEADRLCIPFTVLAELRAGFRGGVRRTQNEADLSNLLAQPPVTVVYANEQTVELWSEFHNFLRKQGKVIPHNDLWIASLCVQYAFRLYTRDKHFDLLPQVMRA